MKRNKSDRERQIPYGFTYKWNLTKQIKKQQNRKRCRVTENKLVVTRVEGVWGMSETGKGD